MSRQDDWREVGGADALDVAIPAHADGHRTLQWLQPLRTRAALGMTPVVAPAMLFVPIGALLGPSFTNVLSPGVLSQLDAVVAVALAVIGVFAGLALHLRGPRDRVLFAAASVEALVTLGVVAGVFLALLRAWGIPLALSYGLVAVTMGLCASVSSAASPDGSPPIRAMAVRIAYLDDFVPIVVSGVVVVMLGSVNAMTIAHAVAWLLRTVLLGLVIGFAGWLLFERTHTRAERNVFIAGIVALIGGTSSFLSLSPLLAGLSAGLLWVWLPGHADTVASNDLQRVQHPLIVVLLLVAGASCEFSRQAVWLAGPLVLFRLTGKLMGAWLASRVQRLVPASEIGMQLMAPGLLGIALAVHLLQVQRTPGMTAVMTAVVAATLISEVLALALRPAEGPVA